MHIRDISMGGAFIETTYPFEVGRVVEMQFTAPGTSTPVLAKGIVRWSNDGSQRNLQVGMGIEFFELRTSSGETVSDLGLPQERESKSPD